jgi:hypothetical protein
MSAASATLRILAIDARSVGGIGVGVDAKAWSTLWRCGR